MVTSDLVCNTMEFSIICRTRADLFFAERYTLAEFVQTVTQNSLKRQPDNAAVTLMGQCIAYKTRAASMVLDEPMLGAIVLSMAGQSQMTAC